MQHTGADLIHELLAAATEPNPNRIKRLTLYLQPDLKDELALFATSHGISMNRAVSIAIRAMLALTKEKKGVSYDLSTNAR